MWKLVTLQGHEGRRWLSAGHGDQYLGLACEYPERSRLAARHPWQLLQEADLSAVSGPERRKEEMKNQPCCIKA